MSGAAYDLSFSMTDAESLLITLRVVDDVTPSDYEYSYDLQGCSPLSLAEGSGITVDDVAKTITIDPGADFRLEAGNYEHGLLSVHKVTRLAQQIFDGSGVVSRSPNA